MEKAGKKEAEGLHPDRVLEMTEWFDAEPERLFRAWTNKKDFMSWYGPEGFTVSFCELDVRVGGAWRACIQSPEGDEYWMEGKYVEIESPSRLVFTYGDGSGKGLKGETLVTISFEEVGEKTRMVFRQTHFPTRDLRDGHQGGWSGAFGCLREFVKTNPLLQATADAVKEISNLMASIDEEKVNTQPYPGSWTAGQLLRHVSKSMNVMAKAMQMDAKPAERDPGERIEQLKVFLDFSKKMQQPDFLIPEEEVYGKQASINELNKFFQAFQENASHADFNELLEGLPLGPITKLEICHFVLYHTQRHLHQMKKITQALIDTRL